MKQILTATLKFLLKDYFYDLVYWYLFFRKNHINSPDKKRIVIVNHFFDQDIEALKIANKDFEFIILDAKILRYVGVDLFPKEVDKYTVFNSSKVDPYKRRYKLVMNRFINKLRKKYDPIAVVSPSDGFFYIRQLVSSLQDHNLPFIVSDKEGTICPAYFVHYAKYIQDNSPLIADHILVWTQRQKEFWEKTGVDSNKIVVVGQPRSDFWKQQNRWKSKNELGIEGLREKNKMILFLTYDPWSYTPEYMIEKGEMHWDVLRNETDAVIFAYAKANPDIDIVIKAHPQQSDIDLVRQSIVNEGVTNVFLVTGPDLSNHLIVSADCIIGFQSTALIESMVTEKPVIYTFWGEAKDGWSADLIPFHENKGIYIAKSPNELEEYIKTAMLGVPLSDEQKKERHDFVMEYLSIVDGSSADRTLDAIKDLCKIS